MSALPSSNTSKREIAISYAKGLLGLYVSLYGDEATSSIPPIVILYHGARIYGGVAKLIEDTIVEVSRAAAPISEDFANDIYRNISGSVKIYVNQDIPLRTNPRVQGRLVGLNKVRLRGLEFTAFNRS